MMVSFVLSFFPRDVLDEILNLIESVSEDFPSYSCCHETCIGCFHGVRCYMTHAMDLIQYGLFLVPIQTHLKLHFSVAYHLRNKK